jgi:HEPN domain-containing protein
LAAEPPDPEDALFHCQQAAEKALKAFLTWHDRPFRKTHDLSVVAKQCTEIDPTIQPQADQLDDLTDYAWAFRYPASFVEPSPVDVEAASSLAHQIVEEIKKRLPPEVQEAVKLA